MIDMEGLRRRLSQLEDYVEKCFLDHGNPDPGKEAEQSCPHDDFLNCLGAALQRIRELRAVTFGDVKAFDPEMPAPGESDEQFRERYLKEKGVLTASEVGQRFSHYHKPCPFPSVDIYRVLKLFDVSDPCLQHAVKKLLVAGGRGSKDVNKDIQEAMDSLARWAEMRVEEKEANRVVFNSRT